MKNKIYFLILTSLLSVQLIVPSKGYFHSYSGTKFNDNYGNFKITEPRIYDNLGKDISVGYNLDYKIALTHYIYPPNAEGLNTHFENYKNSLISDKRNSKLIESFNLTTNNISGKYAKFEYYEDFFGQTQLVYSYLYIYEYNGWFIMLRITSTIENYKEMEKEINSYLNIMPWPKLIYK